MRFAANKDLTPFGIWLKGRLRTVWDHRPFVWRTRYDVLQTKQARLQDLLVERGRYIKALERETFSPEVPWRISRSPHIGMRIASPDFIRPEVHRFEVPACSIRMDLPPTINMDRYYSYVKPVEKLAATIADAFCGIIFQEVVDHFTGRQSKPLVGKVPVNLEDLHREVQARIAAHECRQSR